MMLGDVRREAISVQEPTTADHQVAATASAKIMETETRLPFRSVSNPKWMQK